MDNLILDLKSAIDAGRENKLLEWTLSYLHKEEERNKSLLEDIKKRNVVKTELAEFPLSKLERVSGPLNGEAEPEALHVWVERVEALQELIASEKLPPPIIVTDFWHQYGIADGNHRHEALLKQGFSSYWTIFLFENHHSAEKLIK